MAFSATRYARFKNMSRGRRISGWSRSGGQCVDYVRRFIQVVLGCRTNTIDWIARGNAVDFFKNASPKHFKKVKNTANNYPPEGAIVVIEHTDSQGNKYGHILTADKGCTKTRLYGFSQNWTRHRLCFEEGHRHYSEPNFKVLGWLIAL
jgi:CHAP domain